MKRTILFPALLLAGIAIVAACSPASPLSVTAVRSNACSAGDDCGVFMTIANAAKEDDTLIGVASTVAERTQLHTVVKGDDGNMKMTPIENVVVPASGSVELKPGSYHVMLLTLNRELKEGETFPLTLKYAKAGEMTLQVNVQPAT